MSDNENKFFVVLMNHEHQYSMWPSSRTVPDGWDSVFDGSHVDCTTYIEDNWTDMRPKSLRESTT